MAHPGERLFNYVFMNMECWWREDNHRIWINPSESQKQTQPATEKFILWLTFNPGLHVTLIAFQLTRS